MHLRVRGRVQGVGFRYFVVREARRLGLRGYVRNRADGAVEIVAEGEPTALEAFLRAAHTGPPAARVEGVEAEWSAPSGRFQDFAVRP